MSFPLRETDQLLVNGQNRPIKKLSQWIQKSLDIKKYIKWGLGEEPPSIGPGEHTDYMRDVVGNPSISDNIQCNSMLFGQLFTSTEKVNNVDASKKKPVVIYLHEYSYSTGFVKAGDIINRFVNAGFAVFAFDQIGFGSRIEEGRLFYERFPNWSKMGRMVADVRWAIDELTQNEEIDSEQIFVVGYSLGGTVGLYSAALDERIAGVVSISGFTPMRSFIDRSNGEGIYEYSHLHGLLPRLGFFIGEENRLPYDFQDIIAVIAPRPLMIVAPTRDQFASFTDISNSMKEVEKVYNLYKESGNLKFFTPEDYNRFSNEMKESVAEWLQQRIGVKNYVFENQAIPE